MAEQVKAKKKIKDPSYEGAIRFQKKDWWKYLLALLILGIYLFPFYVIINVALRSMQDVSSLLKLPEIIYLDNFKKAIEEGTIFLGIKNTFLITFGSVVAEIILGCMAAYALARNQTRFNEIVRSLIMSVMMITPLTILVGVYSTMSRLHAISTYWGMIALQTALHLPLVIMLYTNFIASIPPQLDEAATIDGANLFQVFWKIILPQLRAVTVSVIILSGVSTWNEFTYAYYFLQKPNMRTITLVIQSSFAGLLNDYGAAAAVAVIGMLPLTLIYLFLQKYFIKGQMDGAIKS